MQLPEPPFFFVLTLTPKEDDRRDLSEEPMMHF